jgi:hypothetical protein
MPTTHLLEIHPNIIYRWEKMERYFATGQSLQAAVLPMEEEEEEAEGGVEEEEEEEEGEEERIIRRR